MANTSKAKPENKTKEMEKAAKAEAREIIKSAREVAKEIKGKARVEAQEIKTRARKQVLETKKKREKKAKQVKERKVKFLHTRVPEKLEKKIKDRANKMKMPVSLLIRNVLEDNFK